MPAWVYLLGGVGTLLTGAVGAWVLLRKLPIEARKLSVETVDVNVNIAGKLRDVAVRDWERIDAELENMRREFDQYRRDTESRLSEMAIELRAERAEKIAVKRENQDLRDRVKTLEAEVASLKAIGDPHNP